MSSVLMKLFEKCPSLSEKGAELLVQFDDRYEVMTSSKFHDLKNKQNVRGIYYSGVRAKVEGVYEYRLATNPPRVKLTRLGLATRNGAEAVYYPQRSGAFIQAHFFVKSLAETLHSQYQIDLQQLVLHYTLSEGKFMFISVPCATYTKRVKRGNFIQIHDCFSSSHFPVSNPPLQLEEPVNKSRIFPDYSLTCLTKPSLSRCLDRELKKVCKMSRISTSFSFVKSRRSKSNTLYY